jgi:hypothetical protein
VQLWNYANGAMIFGTNNSERLRIDSNGNVGIGTTTPSNFLHVNNTSSILAGLRVDAVTATVGSGGALVLNTPSGSNHLMFETSGVQKWVQYISGNDMRLYSAGDRMTLQGNGNVGIGLTNPQYKLDVAGNINSSETITGNNIVAKYQDVAEWVPSSEPVPAGTVVVLDSTKSNQVTSSSEAYDTRVAGVVSERPGIALGQSGVGKVLVATTGRVLVKVDASRGPIHIGDLLVTSEVPGAAMKSETISVGGVQIHRPGTLIGKALEPLEKGSGKILVLLSLQ